MVKLWWLSLAIFAPVVGVVALLLGLIIAAARGIDRHAEQIWLVGKQIAGNTVSIWQLGKTNDQLGRMVEAVRGLDKSAATLEERVRAQSAAGNGR